MPAFCLQLLQLQYNMLDKWTSLPEGPQEAQLLEGRHLCSPLSRNRLLQGQKAKRGIRTKIWLTLVSWIPKILEMSHSSICSLLVCFWSIIDALEAFDLALVFIQSCLTLFIYVYLRHPAEEIAERHLFVLIAEMLPINPSLDSLHLKGWPRQILWLDCGARHLKQRKHQNPWRLASAQEWAPWTPEIWTPLYLCWRSRPEKGKHRAGTDDEAT